MLISWQFFWGEGSQFFGISRSRVPAALVRPGDVCAALYSKCLVSSASPRNTSCEPSTVETSPGDEVTVTCKTWAFPEATSFWKLPNGTAIYSERMPLFSTINQVRQQRQRPLAW